MRREFNQLLRLTKLTAFRSRGLEVCGFGYERNAPKASPHHNGDEITPAPSVRITSLPSRHMLCCRRGQWLDTLRGFGGLRSHNSYALAAHDLERQTLQTVGQGTSLAQKFKSMRYFWLTMTSAGVCVLAMQYSTAHAGNNLLGPHSMNVPPS